MGFSPVSLMKEVSKQLLFSLIFEALIWEILQSPLKKTVGFFFKDTFDFGYYTMARNSSVAKSY
jgi:hypothetical protein